MTENLPISVLSQVWKSKAKAINIALKELQHCKEMFKAQIKAEQKREKKFSRVCGA